MPHSSVWPVSTRVDDRATHIVTKTVLYDSRCGVSYNFGLSAPCPYYRIRAALVVAACDTCVIRFFVSCFVAARGRHSTHHRAGIDPGSEQG
jgi:hypothetical protein